MPEGDTIHHAAATLRRGLGHGPLTAFHAPGAEGTTPRAGEAIESVEARGKHLLVRFEAGTTLHTHMRMTGTWRVHVRGPGVGADEVAGPTSPRRGRPGRGEVVRIATVRAVATCRDAPVVELLDDTGLRRHPVLAALGPDLCLPELDLDDLLRRLDTLLDPSTEVGVTLLDQRVAAGIGNVYRSEVLWFCRTDPWRPLADVETGTRRLLFSTAADLLRRNIGRWPRRTVTEGMAVYDRAGRPCRRCGAPIRVRRLGEQARTAWWCPACQTSAR
jgi:endonuclease VIII